MYKSLEENLLLSSSKYIKQKDYWLKKLSGEISATGLRPDNESDNARNDTPGNLNRFQLTFPGHLTGNLFKLSKNSDLSIYIILLTTLKLLIHRYTGENDIVVISPVNKLKMARDTVNHHVYIRDALQGEMTFKNLVLGVRESVLDAYNNQDYPMEEFTGSMAEKSPMKHRLFPDIACVLLNIHDHRVINDLNVKLSFCFENDGRQLKGNIFYSPQSYLPDTIERLSRHFIRVLEQASDHVDVRVSNVSLLTGDEKQELLSDFNGPRLDFGGTRFLYRVFAEHARCTPARIAIGYEDHYITYGELNRRANRLARHLLGKGLQEEEPVAVLLERSPLMMESILATWKAGGAYIPLDLQYPVERILTILANAGARFVFARSAAMVQMLENTYTGEILQPDKPGCASPGVPGTDPVPAGLTPNDNRLAYVIYTSGSTGKPKGAMVEHRGMMNHIRAKVRDLRMTASSIVAQNASHTFDISVWQFFSALVVAGRTIIFSNSSILEPQQFVERLIQQQVTVLEVVPSYLSVMLEQIDVPYLPISDLLVTGETIKPHLVRQWFERFPGIKMVNAYGPTEASDDITHYIMDRPPDRESIPIGTPLPNTNIYIVDYHMNLCPIGIRGEICVAGIGVGRGYLNDISKTHRVFMQDPFRQSREIRLYKTGDIGCWLPNGSIEFFGRKDFQVKIRGFRIELEEIERKLLAETAVKEAVVVTKEDKNENKFLCAYLVIREEEDITGIRQRLSEQLPGYMVPDYFIPIRRMPLTPTGKIDRRALPEPGEKTSLPSSFIKFISGKELNQLFASAKHETHLLSKMGKEYSLESPEPAKSTAAATQQEIFMLEQYSRQKNMKFYPLSHPQKMIYYIEKSYPETPCENDGDIVRYPGSTDLQLLEKAINIAIKRNENLRTHIVEIEEGDFIGPAQYVSPPCCGSLEYFNFSGKDGNNRLKKWIKDTTDKPFQLIDSDLFYFALVTISQEECGYYMKLHHVISDGGSTSLLIAEIDAIYRDLSRGKTVGETLNPSHLQFVTDEKEYLQSPLTREDREFWLNYLLPLPETVDLSCKVNRKESGLSYLSTLKGNVQKLAFNDELRTAMHAYCRTHGTSLYKLILSALSLYISRVTGRREFVIGTVNHGRSKEIYKKILGMFINFIPLKIKLESHINFQDLVTQLGENFNHILKKHVRYPFDILSAELRKISRQEVNHFWNITLVGHPDKEKKDFVMEHISSGYEATPLTIHINCDNRDIDGILELEWVYQVEKFSDTHIRDMHQCLMHILEKGLAHPGQPVAGITLPEEEKMLLKGNPDRVTAEEFLQKHEYIDNAVVVKTNRMGEQVLCGYITASKRFSQNRLKDYLSKKIPAHLIPDHFFQLEKMPFSADGSIDRKRLAGLPLTWLISADQTGDDGKPANERENILQRLWAEVLEVPQKDIRTDTSFFELGGHSLKAVVLIAKIHKILDIKIPLAELFNIPTIRGLAEYIGKKAKPGTKENKYAAIVPIEKRQYYELSSAQKRLYFLQQLDIESVGYNISLLLPLGRDMEINKLASTLKHLITRHESLRTSFITVGDEPVQKIHEPGDMEFKIEEVAPPAYNDIKTPGKEKISHWPQKAMFNDFITPFDLSRAPLLRVGVFKNKEAGNLLMVNMHHIITDGTSLEVLRKEFHFLYGNENGSSPLKLQYRDFARWQNNLLSGDNIKKQETYWLKVLEGDIPVLTLPYDYSRPLQRSFEGNSVDFVLNRQAAGELKKLSKETSTTLYMSILSIFAILLSKLSGQEDIIVGMPITGRPHADLEPLIGMFVNTLPIRSYPCGEKTFKQFLMELKKYTIDAFENQDYQFEFLVNKAGVQRDTSRNPIFDAVLNLLNLTRYKGGVPPALNGQDTDSCELKPGHKYPHRPGTSKFDLNLEVVDLGDSNGEELAFTLGYSTQLFKTATIDRFIGYFKMIAETVVEHPWGKISDIEILSNEEKHRLLIEFNRTNAQYPQDKTIYRLFARQVERVPDQVALIGENPNRDVPFDPINTLSEHLTYRELNNQSTLLAHQLKEKGVQADTIVGIRGERSIKMVVGILGILMAGGAYMPIDPAYPEERTKFMLRDSNAGVLITTGAPAGNHEMKEKEESEKTGRWTGEIVNLDQVPADHLFSNFKSFPLERRALTGRSVSTLAYVIYTSGTTGTPKGTLVQHYNVVRLMTNDRFRFDFNKNDVWTLFHSFCFDFSVWEMYGSLLYGGKLVIVPWMIARDTAGFLELLKREKVTVLNQTPSAFYQLMTEELKTAERELNLKYIIFGGEALNPFKLKSWKQRYPKSRLINMYGITETTVHVTFKEITGQDMESPVSCIGVPIPTLTLYIINRFFKLQALGVPGELWVGGEGVSRGYLNRPELTAVKFDHDLWDLHDYHDKNYKKFLQGGPGGTVFTKRVPPGRRRQKLYKTGDLSRWLPNGEMEYLGRIDQQVKIRGYRIELEEIERQLLKHHKVKETVVLAMSTESEDKYLCAYIIPNTDDVTGEEFREYLSRSLPGYMIPTYFTTIEKIPLTPAGKINQKALPAPQIQTGKTQILPGNDIEKKLANIWKEILADQQQGPGTLTIGIDDNFFALGGHSLKAASMISKIQKELDVKIPLAEVFQTPTIRGLARFIFDRGKNKYTPIEVVEKKEYYALSSAQKRLLFLQHLEKNSTGYNAPQVHRIPGSPDIKKLQNIFYKLIKRHESLRTSFEIKNGESVQRVHESHDVAFQVECFDLEQIVQSHGDPATIIEKHITAKFVKPFDLAHAPLFRVGIAAIGGDTLFMLDMHHIITDGTARQVLTREFLLLYNNKDLIPLKLQYKDYSEWQRKTRGKGVLKKQEEYWLNRFKGTVPELNMPVDFTRPDSRSFEGDRVNFFVNESMTDRLHILLSETKTTLYMVLLAAYTILLSKYANQEDIVVGSPVMGRSHPDLHNIIGLFANMAAMRNFPGKTKTFAGFLEEVKTNALDAFENQDYQIEELVGKLKLKRDSGRHPLFEAVLVVQNMDTGEKEIQRLKQAGNFQVEHYNINFTSIQHELLLNVKETKKAIPMSLEFSTKLFKHTTAAKMVDHYLEVLDQVLKNREIKIKDIRISHDLLSATHNFSREEQEDFCL